jgi:hypothetical protein
MKHEEEPSASVPAGDKQAEEDLWQRHKAERGVWPNRYFTGLGLFCLLDAKVSETTSLRQGANH